MRGVSLKDHRIARFCQLIQEGVDVWVSAGELLCALKKGDPNIFVKLMETVNGLSLETLRTFERLGRHEIYPKLLLDGSMGARKLLTLPYAEQERLITAEIPVAVYRHGDIVVEHRKITEMTGREAEIAFNCTSLRPVKEQMALLRPKRHVRENAATPERYGPAPPSGDENEDTPVQPPDSVESCLSTAQQILLRSRELLGDRNTKETDALITKALQAIGALRFTLNEAKQSVS